MSTQSTQTAKIMQRTGVSKLKRNTARMLVFISSTTKPKTTMRWIGQPKVNKVKIFLTFSKFMKRPQTKFHADTMCDSKVMRSKKVQNLSVG